MSRTILIQPSILEDAPPPMTRSRVGSPDHDGAARVSAQAGAWPESLDQAGQTEEPWFDNAFGPVPDEARLIAGIPASVVALTQQALLTATSEAVIAQAVWLRTLIEGAPGLIAVVTGPDHIFEFANSAFLELAAGEEVVGLSARTVVSWAQGRALLELLDEIYTSGPVLPVDRKPLTLTFASDGWPRGLHIDFICKPVIGPDGEVSGVFLEGTDVTVRQLAADRQTLLMSELSHRMKNALSTVLGLARLAKGASTSVDVFLASLTTRIVAMSKTQNLLIANQQEPARVLDVLNVELAPYIDDGGRIDLRCEQMTMAAPAGVTLSLIVHELLTNALKHGAFAAAGGRLVVNCGRGPGGAALTWTETTPQLLASAGVPGFGTYLIERLAHSLGGAVQVERLPGGLEVSVTFKVDPAAGPECEPSMLSNSGPHAATIAGVGHG